MTMMFEQREKFWQVQSIVQAKVGKTLSEDFKELFDIMTCKDFTKRATISEVKKSKWFQGEVYTDKELETLMASRLQ